MKIAKPVIRIHRDKLCNIYLIKDINESSYYLSKWRRRSFKSFFTWTKPSKIQMEKWLLKYFCDPYNLMFIIESSDGNPYGTLSVYNINYKNKTAEFGRIMRRGISPVKGLMNHAVKKIINSVFKKLDIDTIYLSVFCDNIPAISLYKRMGFKTVKELMYTKTKTKDSVIVWKKIAKHSKCTTLIKCVNLMKIFKNDFTGFRTKIR